MNTDLLELLKSEVKPAMGCTEPVAITLAVAKAREIGKHNDFEKLFIKLSPNIFKNALSVGIPKANKSGIDLAAVVGTISGDSSEGLNIYDSIEKEALIKAERLINKDTLFIDIKDTDKKVYIEAEIISKKGRTKVIIENKHNNFSYIKHNDDIIFENITSETVKDSAIRKYTLNDIYDEIEHSSFDELSFLLEGLEMNKVISEIGRKEKMGLGIGYSTKKSIENGELGSDLPTMAMYYTAAASDARMSGMSLPVMSSNGSGNNGLTAILPLLAFKDKYGTSDEKMAKALAISHLVNCYIKAEIGRLSSLCSCGISAATGSGVAITWLLGGSREQMNSTVQSMVANLSGMICDGAKNACAIKLATAASTGVQSAFWSMNGVDVSKNNGIVGRTVEESVKNLGVLSKEGMSITDTAILKIMKEMNDEL